MTNPYRAMRSHPLAQEAYVAFVQICKGGSDDAGTYDADEEIVRRALKRLDELESALLAQPVAVGPTVMEIIELHTWLEDEWRANNDGEDLPTLDFARAVLAKWGHQ
jgi:hypothetical protein